MTERPVIAGGEPIVDEPVGYGGQSVGSAEKEAVLEALDGEYITRGPTVEAFEADVADYLDVEHAVAVTSGTAALHLAGKAIGLGPGDEVITTPLTFAATAFAASYAGATPVFADVKRDTRNLDPDAVRAAVTDDTEALVPVHYAGQPCAVDELTSIAEGHDLTVVWDACHALGSTREGTPVGGEPDLATFSFHAVKNITTAEGGMVVTDDRSIARNVRSLRSFQMDYQPPGHDDEPWYQVVDGLGYNYNFTDVQAALGRVQLGRLAEFKDRRAAIKARYDEAFADLQGLRTPTSRPDVDPMWHLYVVEVGETFGCTRDEFVRALHRENLHVQVHYVPLHYHPYFQREYGYAAGDYPVTEALYDRIVSLPFYPAMSDDEVDAVIRVVERLHAHLNR